jgi:hypothetical protein
MTTQTITEDGYATLGKQNALGVSNQLSNYGGVQTGTHPGRRGPGRRQSGPASVHRAWFTPKKSGRLGHGVYSARVPVAQRLTLAA